MVEELVEKRIESAVQDAAGQHAVKIMRGISKLASMQGGANEIENYRLLGKRALIVGSVVFVVVPAIASAVHLVMSRRAEERRVEKIVRRILDEERSV